MKTKIKLTTILVVILAFCIPTAAYSESLENFVDISGHWAETAIKDGYNAGLITGYDSTTIAPDAPITTAQMITVLCRVLGASETADITGLGISSDVWYADTAKKALYLGLISKETGNLDSPMTRQNALAMIAKAFCLVPAEPDYSVLNSYSDVNQISVENKDALAALVSEKLVQGNNGSLSVNGTVTRAEFFSVLFRIAENYITPDALTSSTHGGSVLKGNGALNYISAGNVWFDCAAERVALSRVTANTVTLRGHQLSVFKLNDGCNISEIVVAVGTGSVSFDSSNNSKISALRLESCVSATIGADVGAIEITGNGISASLSGKHDYLVITGNNNVVTFSSDVSLSRIKIVGENNSITIKDSDSTSISSCDEIEVLGKGNILTFNVSSVNPSKIIIGGTGNTIKSVMGNVSSLKIEGSKADVKISSLTSFSDFSVSGSNNSADISASVALPITISGSLNIINVNGPNGITTSAVSGNSNWITLSCSDIASISVSGMYNTINKYGEGISESVNLPGSCNAILLAEGNDFQTAVIDGSENKATVNGSAQNITINGHKTTLDGSGTVQSLTINASGCIITLNSQSTTDNSARFEAERVLKLVTLGYEGNYTLKWAQEHDYESFEKEIWVNSKGYSSSTEYLVWVNLSMQRVNVFQGSAGNWKLCYSCIVGSGAPGRGTPAGTWTVTYKLWSGWNTSTYTVKPVVGFKQGTGYAFHSRLYYPGSSTLSDASIGYPVSHGCVRMYDQDVKYIYDTIPMGTTVVVY